MKYVAPICREARVSLVSGHLHQGCKYFTGDKFSLINSLL